jgi:tetratricopeptide (TPR) repeat protein
MMEPLPKAEALFKSGQEFYRAKNYKDACDAFEAAIEVDPNFAQAYASWARALNGLDCYQEALEKAQKALELDPNQVKAYVALAEALWGLEDYAGAIDQCRRAIALDSSQEDAYGCWGQALGHLQQTEADLTPFLAGVEDTPAFAELYRGWGNTLLGLKQYGDAIATYRQALGSSARPRGRLLGLGTSLGPSTADRSRSNSPFGRN